MAKTNQDWDTLGRDIQRIVDQAVRSQDYQQLNQTIHQVIDRAVDAGSDAIRRAVDNTTRPTQRPVREPSQPVRKPRPVVIDSQTGMPESQDLPVLYGRTGSQTAMGVLKVVGGGVLTLFGFAGGLASGIVSLVTGAAFLSFATVCAGLGLLGGAGLLTSGIRNLTWVSRFKIYCKALTHVSLEKLARIVGRNTGFVRRDLEKMIDAGLFLEGHIDNEQKTLITSNETYRHYEQSRLALEQRQQEQAAQAKLEQEQKKAQASRDSQVQEVLDKGNAFLRDIRKCNDDIPGQEISEKISRMELIVQRIFQRAEAHPEIVPDLKKLMDYYLPMTVKLLRAYADMDAQPVQGQTIQNSKKEIEDTLDTLNQAFESLLDDLFKDTAMDVSSDISVLQTLLARDGLTEDDLTKMKNSQR